MSFVSACGILGLQASSIWKRVAAVLAFGLLLSLCAFPAWGQDTLQTFMVATSWVQIGMCNPCPSNPEPVDSSSTIVIDTTTGQLSSSHVTAAGTPLAFQSQQSGTGYTLLNFSGTGSDFTGDSIPIKLAIYLPVASLAGYTGGPMCSLSSPCSGGFATDTNEMVNCIPNPFQNSCFGGEVGTWTLNVGQLTPLSANPPDFSLSVTNNTAAAPAGQSATYTINLTPSNGFVSDVNLAVFSGAPPNSSFTFSPPLLTGGAGSTTLTITTSTSTPQGRYYPMVDGRSGNIVHTVSLIEDVQADFNVSVTPAQQTVTLGEPAKFVGTVAPIDGFTGDVSISVSGLPANTTINIEPTPTLITGGSGTFKFTISSNSKAVPGTYPVTVMGTSSGQTSGATLTLIVQ